MLAEPGRMVPDFERTAAEIHRPPDRLVSTLRGVLGRLEHADGRHVRVVGEIGKRQHGHAWDANPIAEGHPFGVAPFQRFLLDHAVQKFDVGDALDQLLETSVLGKVEAASKFEEVAPIPV